MPFFYGIEWNFLVLKIMLFASLLGYWTGIMLLKEEFIIDCLNYYLDIVFTSILSTIWSYAMEF